MLTSPSILLHIEEATLLTLTLFAYQHLHYSWLLFAILFLTPDLFMLGYLVNTRLGAATYNLAHTLTIPFALLLASYLEHWRLTTALALIWIGPHRLRPPARLRPQIPIPLQRHPPPAHPVPQQGAGLNHRSRRSKKSTEIFSKRGIFLEAKNHHPNHHKKPPTHHDFTIKKPSRNT